MDSLEPGNSNDGLVRMREIWVSPEWRWFDPSCLKKVAVFPIGDLTLRNVERIHPNPVHGALIILASF